MRLHTLYRETWLPTDRVTAFEFFCSPFNLERITPPELSFKVVDPPSGELGEGSEIGYQLGLWGLGFKWRSVIRDWDPGWGFSDQALKSPYRFWLHEHRLTDRDDGTWMTDRVSYALPLQPLGELAHFLVRRQLDRIFDYREQTIQAIFSDDRVPQGDAKTLSLSPQ